MFKVGLAVLVIGFGIQMFSGYTYTVDDPSECPDEWDGDPVTYTEVYDRAGEPDGYWCLVQGSYTQTNEPTYRNIPVGERDGYHQWPGFAVMIVGGILVLTSVLRGRSDDADTSNPGKGSPGSDEEPGPRPE